MRHPEAVAAKLLADIAALPEAAMRLVLLARTLSILPPEDSARLLEMIYSKGPEDRGAAAVRSLMVDNDALLAALGRQAYDGVYLASLRLGFVRISRLFTEFEPEKEGAGGYEQEEFIKTEHLTLGERRSLSKSGRIKDIERLLTDPDPTIVSNLLSNPRITEREVLKIASKRPNAPAALKLVALHPKWSRRYEVSKAVARNPYTPPRVAVALMEGMLAQDLKAIAEDTTLHPEVKQAAMDIIRHKGRAKG